MRHDEQSAVPAADSNKAQPRPEPTGNSELKLPCASESKRRRELLRFAKVWAPYGGAPHEEIFVAYGLRPDQFYAQLAVLLLDATDKELTLLQAQLIREQCVEHLGRNAVETIESRRRLEGMQTRLRFSPPAGANRRANTGDSASRSNARSFVAAVGQTALGTG